MESKGDGFDIEYELQELVDEYNRISLNDILERNSVQNLVDSYNYVVITSEELKIDVPEDKIILVGEYIDELNDHYNNLVVMLNNAIARANAIKRGDNQSPDDITYLMTISMQIKRYIHEFDINSPSAYEQIAEIQDVILEYW